MWRGRRLSSPLPAASRLIDDLIPLRQFHGVSHCTTITYWHLAVDALRRTRRLVTTKNTPYFRSVSLISSAKRTPRQQLSDAQDGTSTTFLTWLSPAPWDKAKKLWAKAYKDDVKSYIKTLPFCSSKPWSSNIFNLDGCFSRE